MESHCHSSVVSWIGVVSTCVPSFKMKRSHIMSLRSTSMSSASSCRCPQLKIKLRWYPQQQERIRCSVMYPAELSVAEPSGTLRNFTRHRFREPSTTCACNPHLALQNPPEPSRTVWSLRLLAAPAHRSLSGLKTHKLTLLGKNYLKTNMMAL